MMQQLGFGFEDGVPTVSSPDTTTPRPRAAKRAVPKPTAPVAKSPLATPPVVDMLSAPPSTDPVASSEVAAEVKAVVALGALAVGDTAVTAHTAHTADTADTADTATTATTATPPLPTPMKAHVQTLPQAEPDFEALARQLEAHPDFRVARRLVPRLAFDAPTDGADTTRLLILDTETTGLNHGRDKIIELALLAVDVDHATGLPVGPVLVYDGLEDPGQPIPPEVQAITGIHDDMVRGQRLDAERIAELLDGVDLVVAHNAGFDRPFVEARLPAFAAKAWACSFADIDWKSEGSGSSRLETLALGQGFFYDAHRAEMDCHALLAVLRAVLPASRVTGLSRLLAAVPTQRYRLQATAAPFEAKDALKNRGYRWDAAQKVWHTRLDGAEALEAEADWLKTEVYGQRSARVQVEMLDALVRYSSRPGLIAWRDLD